MTCSNPDFAAFAQGAVIGVAIILALAVAGTALAVVGAHRSRSRRLCDDRHVRVAREAIRMRLDLGPGVIEIVPADLPTRFRRAQS